MSDDDKSYEVDGVKITPLAGGFYELSHASLAEPEKVRGKEKADDRAAEIAAAVGAPNDGQMEQQPPLEQVLQPQPGPDISALMEMMAKQQAQIEALMAMQSTTVGVSGDAPQPDPLGNVPRSFRGAASKEQKALAKEKGFAYVTIVLEEVEDIPPTGLFVSHNGNPYMIMPGEPVDVPDFILEILDHATMSSPLVDRTTQKVLGYRDRMRYPYRRV